MTIKELKQYRDICLEIDDIKQCLESNYYVEDTVTASTPPSYSPHNVRICGYIPNNNTITLLLKLDKLTQCKKEIDYWAKHIPSHKLRKAVKLYYLDPIEQGEKTLTWEEVADIVGNGATSFSLKSSLRRYLKLRHT